jgi:ORF6N domain
MGHGPHRTSASLIQAMNIALIPRIESKILQIRNQRVMIDSDLAELYGVPTKALNQAVKRNLARFPHDFMFQLNPAEKAEVVTNCDHLQKLKFSKTLPHVFTEHGAIQAAKITSENQH